MTNLFQKFIRNGVEINMPVIPEVNTKTFQLSGASDLTTAQAVLDYYNEDNNPVIYYADNIYTISYVWTDHIDFIENEVECGTVSGTASASQGKITINFDNGEVTTVVIGSEPIISLTAGTNIQIAQDGTISAASPEWGDITGTLSDQTDLNTALSAKANDSDVVHLAGAETITGVKTFTANSGTVDGTPAVITPRMRITGQTGSKFKSQLDLWKGNTKKGYLGYFEESGKNRFEFASEDTSIPFYLGLMPWKQNNLTIALTNQGIWRGGTSDTYSADKVFAVIGDLDKRIFSGTTAPSSPTEGQLWYDTTNDVLKSYDGTQWNNVGGGGGGGSYTAGNGISIDANNEISVDTSVVATQTDLSSKQDTIVAGTNISIAADGKTISATDTTYSAGTNISIDSNNEISAVDTTYTATDFDIKDLTDSTGLRTTWSGKADASDVNTKTFYLSNTSDITTAQSAYDRRIAGKNAIIVYDDDVYIQNDMVFTDSAYWYTSKVFNADISSKSYLYQKRIFLDILNGVVQGIYKSDTAYQFSPSLHTGVNYGTPYTPEYDGSPATKKYVDDNVAYVGSSAPSSPSEGRLWYDTTNDVLKTYDGTNWNACGGSSPTAVTVTLTTAGWSNNAQTVTVNGVTENNIVLVSPAPSSITDYALCSVYCSVQGADSLTFACGTTPDVAILVNVLVM